MPTDDTPYDDDFFDAIHGESYASAMAVIPRVMGLTGARSVVDVGCGSGAWSRVCREVGVPEVVGVDGPSVPHRFREPHTEFIEHDLAEPLRLERQFGLAICVEVAEHVPPERAPGLIADLTALAPVVLFSAAVPGQGGTGHLNERWSEYWVALFEAEGWTCRDAIRPWVRANPEVAWWYRQNLYLAVDPSVGQAYSSFPRLAAERPEHPVDYLVRPIDDVMVPPVPPPTEPEEAAAPAIAIDEPPGFAPGNAPGEAAPPPGAEPDGAHVAEAGGEPPDDAPADRPPAPATNGDDEALTFPEPPGWATLRRVAGRARRRSRD